MGALFGKFYNGQKALLLSLQVSYCIWSLSHCAGSGRKWMRILVDLYGRFYPLSMCFILRELLEQSHILCGFPNSTDVERCAEADGRRCLDRLWRNGTGYFLSLNQNTPSPLLFSQSYRSQPEQNPPSHDWLRQTGLVPARPRRMTPNVPYDKPEPRMDSLPLHCGMTEQVHANNAVLDSRVYYLVIATISG